MSAFTIALNNFLFSNSLQPVSYINASNFSLAGNVICFTVYFGDTGNFGGLWYGKTATGERLYAAIDLFVLLFSVADGCLNPAAPPAGTVVTAPYVATCFDRVLNGDELFIDCSNGVGDCVPCGMLYEYTFFVLYYELFVLYY